MTFSAMPSPRNARSANRPATRERQDRQRALRGRRALSACTRPLRRWPIAAESSPSAGCAARAPGRVPTGSGDPATFSRQCATTRSSAAGTPTPESASAGRARVQHGRHGVGGGVALERAPARSPSRTARSRARTRRPAAPTGLPAQLLGRHVAHGAHHGAARGLHDRRALARRLAAARQVAADRARPKSRIFTRPSRVRKTFSGFTSRCTMPAVVRRRQAIGHDSRDRPTRLFHGSAPVCEPGAQRLAVQQLGHAERDPAVHAGVEDRDDVRVRERGDRLRLALEARARRRRPRPAGGAAPSARRRARAAGRARGRPRPCRPGRSGRGPRSGPSRVPGSSWRAAGFTLDSNRWLLDSTSMNRAVRLAGGPAQGKIVAMTVIRRSSCSLRSGCVAGVARRAARPRRRHPARALPRQRPPPAVPAGRRRQPDDRDRHVRRGDGEHRRAGS